MITVIIGKCHQDHEYQRHYRKQYNSQEREKQEELIHPVIFQVF